MLHLLEIFRSAQFERATTVAGNIQWHRREIEKHDSSNEML